MGDDGEGPCHGLLSIRERETGGDGCQCRDKVKATKKTRLEGGTDDGVEGVVVGAGVLVQEGRHDERVRVWEIRAGEMEMEMEMAPSARKVFKYSTPLLPPTAVPRMTRATLQARSFPIPSHHGPSSISAWRPL